MWTAGLISAFHTALPTGGLVTFEVGDKVIYPNHGLGIVERIEDKTILGTTCGFYHLRIVANDTTVLVPLANVDGVGLLGDGKIDNHQNWKGRFPPSRFKRPRPCPSERPIKFTCAAPLAKSKSL